MPITKFVPIGVFDLWFSSWLGIEQAPIDHINLWWSRLVTSYGHDELIKNKVNIWSFLEWRIEETVDRTYKSL